MKNKFLYLSLAVIFLYWTYRLFFPSIPDQSMEFSVFAWRIVRFKIIVFIVVYSLLRLQGEGFADLGFSKVKLFSHIGLGILFGFISWLVIHLVVQQVVNAINPQPPGTGINMAYFNSPQRVLIWLPIGIVGGGFVEELERIFVLTRFRQWLGKWGIPIALVLSTIIFGIAHLYQGVNGGIQAGVAGLLNGLVYLRKRSAAEAVACHAFYDVFGILLAYMMQRG